MNFNSSSRSTFFRLFFRRNKPTVLLLSLCTIIVAFYILHPPWSGAYAIDATAIIESAQNVLKDKTDSTSNLWQTYFFPPSAVYQAIVYLSTVVAGILLITLIFRWISASDGAEILDEIQTSIIWIVVLLIALVGNGQLFATFVYLEKTFADGFIKQVDDFTQANLRFQQANAIFNLDSAIAPQIKACEGKTAQPQIECLTQAYGSASQMLDTLEAVYGESSIGFAVALERWRSRLVAGFELATDPDKNVLDAGATVFWSATSPLWEGIVKAISSAFNTGVFLLIDSLLIALALAGPFAAALSILPVATYSKVFFIWQTAIIGLYGWKIILIFLDSISSEILLSFNADVDTLWFGVVTGLLFTIISLTGVLFGSSNIFHTLSSIGNSVSNVVSKGVEKIGSSTSNSGGTSGSTPKGKPKSSQPSLIR